MRSDLCAFEDQTAELALVHDGFVGLLARADEYGALLSAFKWRQVHGSKPSAAHIESGRIV